MEGVLEEGRTRGPLSTPLPPPFAFLKTSANSDPESHSPPFSELPALNSSAMASLTRENNIVNEPASMHKEPPHKISTT